MSNDDGNNDNTVPELVLDIIMSDILPRISAKSVLRCKSVCKQWLLFLSTPEFGRMHLLYIPNHKLLFIDRLSSCVCWIDCESSDHGLTTNKKAPNFSVAASDVLILASLDGLVCTYQRKTCDLVIWNPVTQAFKKLPNPEFFDVYRDVTGLYKAANDNRVLRVKHVENDMAAHVYSRKSDTWREVGCLNMKGLTSSKCTFSGDGLHFMVRGWCVKTHETLIIRFDVNSENFKEIKFPDVAGYDKRCHWKLVEVENSIYLFFGYQMCCKWELYMWKLEGETWTKVMAFPGINNLPPMWIPEYLLSNGKWLVLWNWMMEVYGIEMETDKYICLYPKPCLIPVIQHCTSSQCVTKSLMYRL